MTLLKTPLRQRAWHSSIIEDADGRTVAFASCVEQAASIVALHKVMVELVESLDELLLIAARGIQGTTDGETKLARVQEMIARAKAVA